MNKLQELIVLSNVRILLKKTVNYVYRPVQSQSNSINNAKYKYENYEHILYSSYLESSVGAADRGRKIPINKRFKIKRYDKHENQYLKDSKSTTIPINWMDDYEYYAGPALNSKASSILGSVDATIPPSNVPCNGCGAHLHCTYQAKPGFIPAEIFKGRTISELMTMICQRCHFLKFYNIVLDIELSSEFYSNAISQIHNDYALVVIIVDLLDFPCSIWPKIHELLGPKRPVMIVGNKVDLLPQGTDNYLDQVKNCLQVEIIKCGFDRLNIKDISLISAKTGFGVEDLITKLQHVWSYDGNVYLIGCSNVGKSSLFNILLNSDYSRPESMKLIPQATASPWPGTTLHLLRFPICRPTSKRKYERFKRLRKEQLEKSPNDKQCKVLKSCQLADVTSSESISRTPPVPSESYFKYAGHRITKIDENMKIYQKAKWLYDTPGVMHPDQITDLLTAEELLQIQPQKKIQPRAFRLEIGTSLFVAGLARLDLIEIDTKYVNWIQILLYASLNLPTLLANSEQAAEVYNKYLNTSLLQIPFGNEDRMSKWPGLKCPIKDLFVKGCYIHQRNNTLGSIPICSADIILSSVGWVGLKIPNNVKCRFRAWTPFARGIHLRMPSLIPYANPLIGSRIKNSLAYNLSKPFVFKKDN